ncbi:hypothetical protein ACLOJK_022790 [Asimina triloba]
MAAALDGDGGSPYSVLHVDLSGWGESLSESIPDERSRAVWHEGLVDHEAMHCSCDDIFNADDVDRRRGSLWARHAHADIADMLACSGRGSEVGKHVVGGACDVWRHADDSNIDEEMDVVDEADGRASSGGSVLGHDQGSTT